MMDDFFLKDKINIEAFAPDEDPVLPSYTYSPPLQTEEEQKFKRSTDLSHIIGTMKVDMSKPNTKLTKHHTDHAKMAHAATRAYKYGIDDAQTYLHHEGINKTIADSNRYGIMLVDNETTKYTLALRGTDPTSPRDIFNTGLQSTGKHESLTVAKEMLNKTLKDGGQVERITGFSAGASDGLSLSMERGIDATLFDPPIYPRNIWRNARSFRTQQADIEIIRNPENILSLGTAARNLSLKPQFRVSVVPTGERGIVSSHELLPNFTKTQLDEAQLKAEYLAKVGTSAAQSDTLIAMKEAINESKTFTEFHRELNSNSGVDVDVDGIFNKLGSRVNKEAPLVKMWMMVDGQFTDIESSHLLGIPHPEIQGVEEITRMMGDLSVKDNFLYSDLYSEPTEGIGELTERMGDLSINRKNTTISNPQKPQEIIVDRDILEHINRNELETAKTKTQNRLTEGMDRLNSDEVMSHPAVRNSVAEHLRNSLHPVNMATGTIAGLAGAGAMSIVDPSGSFGQYNEEGVIEHTAVSGTLTGAFSDIMMNGMSGGAGLVSKSIAGISVAAGAGAIAGEGARYGVEVGLDKLGANTDTKESLADISGGVVGGAVTAGVGDLATIGTAALMGAEVGELGGVVGVAVGAGVGAAFGLAAYGLGKLNHISAVQKAESEVADAFVGGTKKTYNEAKKIGRAIGKWFR
tara:strand:+ start:3242 stop:5314 length:2073 start_codon:yes stop_codon:yes gene_type:complete